MDLVGSPVCPGSRGWGQSRGDKWTGPDTSSQDKNSVGFRHFSIDGERQKEGTAVVWEKGPTEANSEG